MYVTQSVPVLSATFNQQLVSSNIFALCLPETCLGCEMHHEGINLSQTIRHTSLHKSNDDLTSVFSLNSRVILQ